MNTPSLFIEQFFRTIMTSNPAVGFSRLTTLFATPLRGVVWSDGEMILFRYEKDCNEFADWLEFLYPELVVNTGYYDPSEDEKSHSVDAYSGFYYVSIY